MSENGYPFGHPGFRLEDPSTWTEGLRTGFLNRWWVERRVMYLAQHVFAAGDEIAMIRSLLRLLPDIFDEIFRRIELGEE